MDDLARRRCAVHTQMHGACMDTSTDAQRRFWHDRDNHAGASAHVATARLAASGVRDWYLWGDSTTVADAHHLLCELVRGGFTVAELDASAHAAALRRALPAGANATGLHPWIRLPFKTIEACNGVCVRVHAMRVFRVARLGAPGTLEAYLTAAMAVAAPDARVAHVFNEGLYSWPGEKAKDYVHTIVDFLDGVDRWRRALPEPRRALVAWRETYARPARESKSP